MNNNLNYNLFEGERIILTAPAAGDEKVMVAWYQDVEFMRNVDTDRAKPKNEETIKEMNEKFSKDPENFLFHFRHKETGELIGFIGLDGMEWSNGTTSLSIGIGDKKNRGMGYGTEAMELILQYAFTELNLHRVGLNFLSYNKSGEKLYTKLGFKKEGVRREFIHRDGRYYDLIDMGILRHEWEALHGIS